MIETGNTPIIVRDEALDQLRILKTEARVDGRNRGNLVAIESCDSEGEYASQGASGDGDRLPRSEAINYGSHLVDPVDSADCCETLWRGSVADKQRHDDGTAASM